MSDADPNATRDAEQFWHIAEPYLHQPAVTRSTMMGHPCLRLHGNYFASWDPSTGSLVAKLDTQLVTSLIERGHGQAFSPNGRRFREWIAIPASQHRRWSTVLQQAYEHAGGTSPDAHLRD